MTRAQFYRWLDHYMPLWATVLIALIRVALQMTLLQLYGREPSQGDVALYLRNTNWGTELMLALLPFWLWAVTTNAHGHKLVCTSGRESGTKARRQHEYAAIRFFSLLSLGLFFVSLVPQVRYWAMLFPVASACMAYYLLGAPPCESSGE